MAPPNPSPLEAAMAAWAQEPLPPGRSVAVAGRNRILILGKAADAYPAGQTLASDHSVTILLTDPADGEAAGSSESAVAVVRGQPAGLEGHAGNWTLALRDRNVVLEADAVLDLSGAPSLVPAPELRCGYERCDPRRPSTVPAGLAAVAACASGFEHPLYVEVQHPACAHARSRIQGCTRCLDLCPPGALTPAGDHVELDPLVCAGCGLCAAACPSGALRYDLPAEEATLARLRTALQSWNRHADHPPVVLLHGDGFGAELVETLLRFREPDSSCWLPLSLGVVSAVSADLLVMALAWGAARVVCVGNPAQPDTHRPIDEQIRIANTVTEALGFGSRVTPVTTADPEVLLEAIPPSPPRCDWPAAAFLPMGKRREGALQAIRHLHVHAPEPADVITLPKGAHFGAVDVDPGACTLCLACVGACPTGALQDDPDTPRLGFQEDACIQCGLCRATCPEDAITLRAGLHLEAAAGARKTLHEEPPFACIACGRPFGVRLSIERTLERLAEHPLLAADSKLARRVKMCADCRVIDQFRDSPAQGTPARPRVRTAADYRTGTGLRSAGQPDGEGGR